MLTIEAPTRDRAYSPFHMLGSALAGCTFSVLQSWASNKNIHVDDLTIEVKWKFAEGEHRVERPSQRLASDAQRAGEGSEARALLTQQLSENGSRPAQATGAGSCHGPSVRPPTW